MYQTSEKTIWKGREDEPRSYLHQVVDLIDLNQPLPESIKDATVLLGFKSDTGVKRNFGREGAKEGPVEIRKNMAGLTISGELSDLRLYDAGNVVCDNGKLEVAFDELITCLAKIFQSGGKPILLGGGHEISYPHYMGIKTWMQEGRVGCINLDPHFDIRKYPHGSHSGSSFRQILDEHGMDDFQYFPVGINPASNIQELFDTMVRANKEFILMREIKSNIDECTSRIQQFIDRVDAIYLTLDMDVFQQSYAPGVSAPSAYGLTPHEVIHLIEFIFASKKVISMDIAETCPRLDIDNRTSKLAAYITYIIISQIYQHANNLG